MQDAWDSSSWQWLQMHSNLVWLRRDENWRDIVEKWRGSVAHGLVDDNTRLEPSISEWFVPQPLTSCFVWTTLYAFRVLYTESPLGWQHWNDQHNKNEYAPAGFVFFKWRFKDFARKYKLPRSHTTVWESLDRDPGNLSRMIRSILTKHKHIVNVLNKMVSFFFTSCFLMCIELAVMEQQLINDR